MRHIIGNVNYTRGRDKNGSVGGYARQIAAENRAAYCAVCLRSRCVCNDPDTFRYRCKVCDAQFASKKVEPRCKCGERAKIETLNSAQDNRSIEEVDKK